MVTITLTLADDQLARLQELATQQGLSVEALVEAEIASLVKPAQPSCQDASDCVLQKNAQLHQRLAEDLAPTDRGSKMAASLKKLADRTTFAEIEDPVAWQREIRHDRPLHGRDE